MAIANVTPLGSAPGPGALSSTFSVTTRRDDRVRFRKFLCDILRPILRPERAPGRPWGGPAPKHSVFSSARVPRLRRSSFFWRRQPLSAGISQCGEAPDRRCASSQAVDPKMTLSGSAEAASAFGAAARSVPEGLTPAQQEAERRPRSLSSGGEINDLVSACHHSPCILHVFTRGASGDIGTVCG